MVFKKILMAASVAAALGAVPARGDVTLLNVSYDPTRELYQEFNAAFARHWTEKTKETSGNQAIPRRLGQAGALRDRRTRG